MLHRNSPSGVADFSECRVTCSYDSATSCARKTTYVTPDVFQHSGETVSRHFHVVLRAFAAIAKEMIKPPALDETPFEILRNMKYYPWFKDCIVAIDGTHIPVVVPANQAIPYRSRRKKCIEHVMIVYSFDMRFTWIWLGWEGSAYDFRIFTEAMTRPNTNFPHPPQGKYYVVDAGYPNTRGYLAPYRGCRYHLQDYKNRARVRGYKKIFNHAHSSTKHHRTMFSSVKSLFPYPETDGPVLVTDSSPHCCRCRDGTQLQRQ